MSYRPFLLALILVLVLSLAPGPLGSFAKEPVKVTGENNGQTITLAVDDMLDVVLRGNPGTGLTWELETEDLGALQGVAEAAYVPDGAVPGAPGTYVFHFAVVESGMSGLSFAYRRPWERDAEPAQTFNISINVPPSE